MAQQRTFNVFNRKLVILLFAFALYATTNARLPWIPSVTASGATVTTNTLLRESLLAARTRLRSAKSSIDREASLRQVHPGTPARPRIGSLN